MSKKYNGVHLDRVAFPLGGIGAGMMCLEGTGALSHVSLRVQPNVFFEPYTFSAICVKGESNTARVLEGPVPRWKGFGQQGAGNGLGDRSYGLPRFRGAEFASRFPFASIKLSDEVIPLQVEITGWSPFIPGDSDNSSLPIAALEYKFTNTTNDRIEAVYSFNSRNFMAVNEGRPSVVDVPGGLVFREIGNEERPWEKGELCVRVDDENTVTDCAWFRGGWFDNVTMAWNNVQDGRVVSNPPLTEGAPSPGGSIFVPFELALGEEKAIRLMFSWYVPDSDLSLGHEESCCCNSGCKKTYKPWYSAKFSGIDEVSEYWKKNYDSLRTSSAQFSDCFFDTSLPSEAIEAIEGNLAILKSPTVLRQTDGRLWCWEGCCDRSGCCSGSCTHVWNYAQALPHLFPDLERSLRQTEFNDNQDENGHQAFRAALPIGPVAHDFHAAADGQLGGIIKIYREWRISGDAGWLKGIWPKVKQSLDYCISTWDPDHEGVTKEPHHNTYDIEFWGADGMCSSIYLSALKAATIMGEAMGEDVSTYSDLLAKGLAYMDSHLFNGEYYYQKVQWEGLRAGDPLKFMTFDSGGDAPEAAVLLQKEGPKYQYGTGCLSDGVIGFWMADVAGIERFANDGNIKSHLASVHNYNLKHDFTAHANPQRPTFAYGDEGGLILCTWPNGGKPSLPFVYSDEVWTGIEYQVAAHLIMNGLVEEGLDVVRTCRNRYDGKKRNPFNEYECGHWYARAMSSYSLLQALSGARYDAVEKTLYLKPMVKGDFRSFLCTATGYGTVGIRNGEPFIEVKQGEIKVDRIDY